MTGDFITGQEVFDGHFDCPRCGYKPAAEERCWTLDYQNAPVFHCQKCGGHFTLEKVADPN